MELAANMVGTLGVALVVLAYYLLTSERISSKQALYHALNCSGATLILLSLLVNWNLPSVIIESIWIALSLYGLWKVWRRKPRSN